MEITLNQKLVDRQVLHALRILRLSNGETKRILQLLLDTEKETLEKLIIRLASMERRGVDLGPVTTRRLRNLLRELNDINSRFWEQAGLQLRSTAAELGVTEVQFQQRLLQEVFATSVTAVRPNLNVVRGILNATNVLGVPFTQLLRNGRDRSIQRVEQAIRIGLVSGETTPQIIRRVRNIQRSANRTGVTALVRTVINHVSSEARQRTFEENSDFIEGVMWVATLDTRTCLECADLDGERFKLREGRRPPAHLQCRCTTVPLLRINEQIFGERASQFGAVPASDRFPAWLARQSAAIQDEALGRSRGRLFRSGDLEIGDFVDQTGRTFTLTELAAREIGAFTMSGVAPP